MVNPTKQASLDKDTLKKSTIINPKNHLTKKWSASMCAACQLARLTRKQPSICPSTTPLSKNKMKLKTNDLIPGECISLDQYKLTVQGWLTHTKGRKIETKKYRGGTIAVDHCSGKIWLNYQVSLRSGENLQGTHVWEYDLAQYGFKVQSYHSNNDDFL